LVGEPLLPSSITLRVAVSAALAAGMWSTRHKTRTAKANKRQEKPYRQRHFGRLAKLANGNLWLSLGREAQATTAGRTKGQIRSAWLIRTPRSSARYVTNIQ
jgi:hypothetical protein